MKDLKLTFKKKTKTVDSQSFVNLEIDKENETIQLKSTNEYLGAICVSPINIFGIRENEQMKFINTLEMFVNHKKFKVYQIYSSESGADIYSYAKRISQLQLPLAMNIETNKRRFQILEQERRFILNQSNNRNLVDKYFYIIFKADSIEELDKIKHDAMYLLKTTFICRNVDFEEYIKTIYQYFNPYRSLFEFKKIKDIKDISELDFISPSTIGLGKHNLSQYIMIDGIYCKMFHVYSYPNFPFFAWLSYLTGFKNVNFSVHVEDCNNNRLIKEYDRQYNNIVKNYDKATKPSEKERLKQDMESVQLMIQSLTTGTRKAVSFVTTLRIEATTLEELKELENYLTQEIASLDMFIRQGFFDQKELFYSSAPLCCNQCKEYGKDVVCNVLSWGFPFVFESLNDQGDAILIGKSRSTGGAIFYNHLLKSKTRTNSNEILFGTTGSGKTYFLMYLIMHRFSRGMKQIIIDVEGKQMNKLTKHLHGEVVNCSNGNLGIINPLQIRIVIDDDESGDKISLDKIYPLSSHIQFLRTLLGMYFTGLDRLLLAEVEDALEELYSMWGFTYETTAEEISRKSPTEFPIMQDLYELMEKRFFKVCEKEPNNLDKRNRVEVAKGFIRRMALGADSPMFNGYTNISLNNDMICFNLAGLQNKDLTILRTQYYNILSYILTEIISGRFNKWIQLYEDEFHLMMNKDMPEVMLFQKMLIKIIRKYNGGLTTSTQEVLDTLNESVKEYGSAIIGNSNYKFFFKQEAESIQYLKEHKIISEQDAEYLQYCEIGQCYFSFGGNALQIEVDLPDYAKELFDSFIINEQRV